MKEKEILFVMNYARSGGTMLNRYFHKVKDLVILSEAHPINTVRMRQDLSSIVVQAKEWYGIEVQSLNFVDQIEEIKNWCDLNNKQLLIRDWSYIDFTPSKENSFNPPYKSVNLELLEKRFNVKKIAFIRNAIDVLLSRGVKIEAFSKHYFEYINYLNINNIKVYKYEDFCNKPQTEFTMICSSLGIQELKIDFDKKLSNKVVGDTKPSRGNANDKIVLLKRRYQTPFQIKKINHDDFLQKANNLYGYKNGYESESTETFLEFFKKRLLIKLKKLQGNK